MSERLCCICKKSPSVSVASFPLLREGYPMCSACNASWRIEAQALGGTIYNPAKLHMCFQRWMAEART